MKQNLSPIREGEMVASDVVIFFDNVCDNNGNKLTKSAKRTRIRELMMQLYYLHPEDNNYTLPNQECIPIIVCRRNEGRAASCYFNNLDAPQNEILQAFADRVGITYQNKSLEPKREGELIATDAKQFLDDVSDKDGKKLVGTPKLIRLHQLFATLYQDKTRNVCHAPLENIPIVVLRKGENEHIVYCLNTSEYRREVLAAFAAQTGCTYLEHKEGITPPPHRQSGEMTARECARIFHNVPNLDGSNIKRDASPKLVEWFEYIGNNEKLNRIRLPDGTVAPVVVYRQSGSQRCWCLNSADERVKPFVIKRVSQISQSDICLDNITFSSDKAKDLYQSIITLAKLAGKSKDEKASLYYEAYAKKIYHDLRLGKETNLSDWLINQKQGKE